jgi:hypothetical protein
MEGFGRILEAKSEIVSNSSLFSCSLLSKAVRQSQQTASALASCVDLQDLQDCHSDDFCLKCDLSGAPRGMRILKIFCSLVHLSTRPLQTKISV